MRFSSFTYLVGQGLHNLRANRLMTFASMGVLTVCMLLIGAAYLLGVNIDAMVEYIGDQNETVVYMNLDASEEQIAAADSAIRSTEHVVGVTYVSPQEVLSIYNEALADYINLEEAFSEDNPFYPNYRVVVDSPDNIPTVKQQLEQIDGVYQVNAPLELSNIFVSLQKAITYACYAVVAVLAIVSIVVINNTIKITVFNRRKEIGIMKLVGATNGFIRFPFFVEGVASGLIAAAIASGVVCGAYYGLCRWYVENPTSLTQMFGGQLVPLTEVWYYIVVGFALLGFVLCGIGTATSIRKHLNV
ncbi:permease-like cell division protein FtsX [uncultured Subdoligranulum sp.]|uniref:permease-like cell division protein FtsX n=1 Tax=uncultured Subdoligranulum sp. TaxID=512298 RepID=UPI00262C14A6|nr:permease-like cell division protein FtsX [uncultured Subdoligranulum sp.]